MKKILLTIWQPLVVLLLVVPIILPYFHSGYFPTHDGEWAVVRLSDMYREVRDHQFPPRYSGNLNFGYGYPLFNFAYPLPYYVGLIVHFLKFSFTNSIKIVFAGSVLLSAIFMYKAGKAFWGSAWAGICSGMLFAYLPYRLVDLYARGSIGELFAFIFFPLLFYTAVELYKNPKQYFFIAVGAFAIGGLILSHNIMAILFMPIFLLFTFALLWKDYKKYLKSFFAMIFLGLCMSSFFWLPALAEKNLILLSKIPIADRSINYVRVDQLFFGAFGYGIPEAPGGFTYQIGWPHIMVILASFLLLVVQIFKKNYKKTVYIRVVSFLLLLTIGMVLMMFPFTDTIWRYTPLLKEINYPWTMLGPLGFIVSFLSGFLFTQGKKISLLALCLGCAAIVLYLPHAVPQMYTYHDDGYYFTNDATTTSSSEYTPLWVKIRPLQRPKEKVLVIFGDGNVTNISENSKRISFNAQTINSMIVRINTIYYPGWIITIDGKRYLPTYKNQYGVMDIFVNPGKHAISADFTETSLRLAVDIISLINIISVSLLFIYGLLKKNAYETH